jgi:3-deoxy-D-manno-octulosonic-acid transferase
MHCASLGEFEQGRPVLEALRRAHPHWRVLLTFFSPSGYERCKDTDAADHVAYLPADGPRNARRWLAATQPDVAIFVKYEFWYFHLRALHRAGVPTFLVAGSFRPGQRFFRPRAGWWRKILGFFTTIAVQTAADHALLTGPGQLAADRVIVTGDPRVDRTLQLADTPFTDEILATFTAGKVTTIIAGSVWPPDVAVWRKVFPQLPLNYRLVLAPHQLHEAEIAEWAAAFGAVRYGTADTTEITAARVLILDTIGILSRAYRYGDLAYIGGAFKTGLHNTLEPLAYDLPVIFGPKHHKFPEAAEAIRRGGAFSINNAAQLLDRITQLQNPTTALRASKAQQALAAANAGAGERTAAVILSRLGITT